MKSLQIALLVVASKKIILCALVLFHFVLPSPTMARQKTRQISSSSENVWLERTGIDTFHRQLDQLFSPMYHDKVLPLVLSGGPANPTLNSDSARLDIDGQGLLQGRFSSDPLQMPSPVFPYRPQELTGSNLRWIVGTGFQLSLPGGFSLLQRTLIGSQRSLDPTARTKDYRQLEASIEIPWATINFHSDNVHLWLGRNWEKWGPGFTGSLILDSSFPSPDGFGATWNSRILSLRYRAGRIDDFSGTEINYHRYFFGHRLDFSPLTNLRIGLSETALVATDGGLPLWGVNPLLPWVMAEQEGRGDMEKTNIVWAIDSVWNLGKWVTYGQFLLDDYMIDSEDRDTYPDQLGLMAGLAYERAGQGQWAQQRLGIEYNRLWSWTYVHRDPELIYQAWQQGMGHTAGSDSETITAFWAIQTKSHLKSLLAWGRYHHQGQVWLGTNMDPVGSSLLPYPVPPTSSWWQAGLDMALVPSPRITTRLQLGWADANVAHSPEAISPPPSHQLAVSKFYGSFTVSLNFGTWKIHP